MSNCSSSIGPNPLVAQNDAISLMVQEYGCVGVQLAGTWSGTVSFTASIDGVNYVALSMEPSSGTTLATTATANGLWSVNCAGYAVVRVQFTTATSGTVKASILGCGASGAAH